MKNLTQKLREFALAYVETGNRVEAYRRACNHGRMKERTVSRKAQEVAALPDVAAEIETLHAQALCRSKLTVEWECGQAQGRVLDSRWRAVAWW